MPEQLPLRFWKDVNLQLFLNLPPKEAIKYFEKKTNNKVTYNWYDMLQEDHTKAFTVAKSTVANILTDIRTEVEKSLKEGRTFHQFKKDLLPILEKKGWTGFKTDPETGKRIELGTPRRLQIIYNTNLRTAYSAGRYKAFLDNAENRPYWQYKTQNDELVRKSHRLLKNKVFHYTDPIWNDIFPPNGWGCRCRVIALSERDLKRMGLKVESSAGRITYKEVPVSPNSNKTVKVAVYTDPSSGEQLIPDAGWSYNPGQSTFEPIFDKYPKDIRKIFFTQLSKEKTLEKGKINFKTLSDYQAILPSDTDAVKWDKAVNNSRIIGEEIQKRIEKEFKRKIKLKQGYIYADEKTWKKLVSEDLQEAAGVHLSRQYIIISPLHVNLAGNNIDNKLISDAYGIKTIIRETIHALSEDRTSFFKPRNDYTFLEEGTTEILTRSWMLNNMNLSEDEKKNLIYSSHQYQNYCTDLILNLAKRYKGNKEKIFSSLKSFKTSKITTKKNLSFIKNISFTSNTINEQGYITFLENLEKNGILKKEIEKHKEKLQGKNFKDEEFQEFREEIIKWLLKK